MRLVLIATALLVIATTASADPIPDYLGDKAPPRVEIDEKVLVSGPLAPRTATEWLRAIAPSFSWGEKSVLARAKITRRSRDVIEARLDVEASADVHTLSLRVFRKPIELIALAEAGVCCCNACTARIVFFRLEKQRLVDVTDQVWPRFPFVVAGGKADSRLLLKLPRRGSTITIYDAMLPGKLYRARWSKRARRFIMTWKHPKAGPPYRRIHRCKEDKDCWPRGKAPKLREGEVGLICDKGRCRPVPIPR